MSNQNYHSIARRHFLSTLVRGIAASSLFLARPKGSLASPSNLPFTSVQVPGNSWQGVPGWAKDIGVGADGTVYCIGDKQGIFRWNGTSWDGVDGSGIAVAVGPNGIPWVVGSDGKIYRRRGNSWENLGGRATDIGVGVNGGAWICYYNEGLNFRGIWVWDEQSR